MKNKKSNKGITLLIIAIIILILLLGFIIINILKSNTKEEKKDNNTTTITTSTTTTTTIIEPNKWERILSAKCLNENIEEECTIYKDSTFDITLKDLKEVNNNPSSELNVQYSIYINGNKIEENSKDNMYNNRKVDGYNITKLDDNHILVEQIYYEASDYTIYNNEGKIIKYFNPTYLIYEDSEFKLTYTRRFADWTAVNHCDEISENETFETKSTIPYLGNGVLGEEVIISEKTLSDVLYDECQVRTCEEAKVSCYR